jgi:tetrahydromethanopterin S-methyltransferase subunit E
LLGLSIIPDVALGVVGVAIAALVKVVWSIAARLSRLEGELGVDPSERRE